MDNTNNILIIENQKYQYDKIRNSLKEYNIFPSGKKYDEFTNWVRVYVSNRYNNKKENLCLEKIVKFVNENKIDLLFIDFKIAGNHDGRNGIDFAVQLMSCDINLPILFLTQSLENSKEVKEILEEFKTQCTNFEWAYKGYAGLGLFDEDYFHNHVKVKIPQLLINGKRQTLDSFLKRIDLLINNPFLIYGINKLKQVKEDVESSQKPNEKQITFINQLESIASNASGFSNSDVENKFNNYEQ